MRRWGLKLVRHAVHGARLEHVLDHSTSASGRVRALALLGAAAGGRGCRSPTGTRPRHDPERERARTKAAPAKRKTPRAGLSEEPTPGLEPGTPSLRVKSPTVTGQ